METTPIQQISKRVHYTFSSLLQSKYRNFIKRSLLRYFIASILFYYAYTNIYSNDQGLKSFFIIFLTLLALSWTTILLSSYIQSVKRKNKSFVITFKDETITLIDDLTGKTEEKNWDWVKQAELWKGTYYMDINKGYREGILLKEVGLTATENQLLYAWLKTKGKIK